VQLFYKVDLMEGLSDFLLFCVIDSVFYFGLCIVYVIVLHLYSFVLVTCNLCFFHGLLESNYT